MICKKCLKEIRFDDEPCWCEYEPESRPNKIFITPVYGKPHSFIIRCCPVCGKELKNGVPNYPTA